MIGLLRQKARAIVWRLTPCSRAKYNALIISLAEDTRWRKHRRETEEEYLRREDQAWERELERRWEETGSMKRNRKELMKMVMSGYGLGKQKQRHSTEYILIEDGVVKRTLLVQRGC